MMNEELARVFGTGVELRDRVHQHLVRDAFIKSATAEGVHLGRLSDADVLDAYNSFQREVASRELEQAKHAELDRVGRSLARHLFVKIAQPLPVSLGELDPHTLQALWGQIPSGGPAQSVMHAALRQSPIEMAEQLAARGVDPAAIQAELRAVGVRPDVISTLFGKDSRVLEAFKAEGMPHAATYGALPKQPVISPELMVRLQNAGLAPGAAQAAETGLARYSPFGMMKALKGGQWGTVARKVAPIAGGLAAFKWLTDRKREQEQAAHPLGAMGG